MFEKTNQKLVNRKAHLVDQADKIGSEEMTDKKFNELLLIINEMKEIDRTLGYLTELGTKLRDVK